MIRYKDHAVSPVVGVMLMLVVTIIIAAIVSGFSGGLAKGQTKAPQATITATFSERTGMTITHAGGETLATSGIVITTRNGPTFGSGLESKTINTMNLSIVTNSAGTPVAFFNPNIGHIDGYNISAFAAGDTWFVNITNCDPRLLQPTTVSGLTGVFSQTGNNEWSYTPSTDPQWALAFANPDNAGKQFYLTVSDRATGAIISQTAVTITG